MNKNKIKGDAGYIADELMSNKLTDVDRRCIVALKTIKDKDFSFEESLKIYDLSIADFEDYFFRNFMKQLDFSISDIHSKKITALLTINLISKTYKKYLSAIDKDAKMMEEHFNSLSKQIENNQFVPI